MHRSMLFEILHCKFEKWCTLLSVLSLLVVVVVIVVVVVSRLQVACRRKYSRLHTALLLQESIASLLEDNTKVFVLYLDVKKAFDSVWIDGLFHHLYALGVTGKTGRTSVQELCRFSNAELGLTIRYPIGTQCPAGYIKAGTFR